MGEILKWSYIHIDCIIVDGNWWQQVFPIDIAIPNRGIMISQGTETVCFLG